METSENNQSGRDRAVPDEAELEASHQEDSRDSQGISLGNFCGGLIEDLRDFLTHKTDESCAKLGESLADLLSLFLLPREEPTTTQKKSDLYQISYCVVTLSGDDEEYSKNLITEVVADSSEAAISSFLATQQQTLSRKIEVISCNAITVGAI